MERFPVHRGTDAASDETIFRSLDGNKPLKRETDPGISWWKAEAEVTNYVLAGNEINSMQTSSAHQVAKPASGGIANDNFAWLKVPTNMNEDKGIKSEEVSCYTDTENGMNTMTLTSHHQLSIEPIFSGGFSCGKNHKLPFNIDADLDDHGVESIATEEIFSNHEIKMMKYPAARQKGELASNQVISCSHSLTMALKTEADLGLATCDEAASPAEMDIDTMEADVPHRHTQFASNQVISDGLSPILPFNKEADLGEITDYSRNELESSPSREGITYVSNETISKSSNHTFSLNKKVDLAPGITSSEETASQVGNEMKSSLAHQGNATNEVMYKSNNPMSPLDKEANLGVAIGSPKEAATLVGHEANGSPSRQDTANAANQVISGITSAVMPLNKEADPSDKRDLESPVCKSFPAEARCDDVEQTYRCRWCAKDFPSKHEWIKHRVSVKHDKNCPHCAKSFKTVNRLLEHVFRSHESEDPSTLVPESVMGKASEGSACGKFRCRCCREELDTVKDLVRHLVFRHARKMKALLQDKVMICWICDMELSSETILERHIKGHTGERTVPCHHCDKYFATKKEQRRHIKYVNMEKRFKCELCGKSFKRQNRLHDHLVRHGSEKRYQCPHCSKAFKFENNLREHIRVHTGEKPYECRHCDMVFATVRQRLWHERKKHDEGTKVKEYKCEQCPKTFKRYLSLYCHRRLHAGKGFSCDQCSFVALQKYNLGIHYVKHTGEKPFKCDVCSMSYTQKSRLNVHMRTHTGEKPYRCEQCDKAFIDSYSLKRHQRTHTGEKPYKCSYCSKSFAQGCQRLFHERTHTGDKPYACSQCDKTFSRNQELNKHVKTHEKAKRATKVKIGGSSKDLLLERGFTRGHEGNKAKQAAKGKTNASNEDTQRGGTCTSSQGEKKLLSATEKVKTPAIKRKRKLPGEGPQLERGFVRGRDGTTSSATMGKGEKAAITTKQLKPRGDSQRDERSTQNQEMKRKLSTTRGKGKQTAKEKRI